MLYKLGVCRAAPEAREPFGRHDPDFMQMCR